MRNLLQTLTSATHTIYRSFVAASLCESFNSWKEIIAILMKERNFFPHKTALLFVPILSATQFFHPIY